MATKEKKAKARKVSATPQPLTEAGGWLLCEGDSVLILSKDAAFASVEGKRGTIDRFLPSGFSCFVQLPDRPGQIMLPCNEVQWMPPAQVFPPTALNQRVRVLTGEVPEIHGQLGYVKVFDEFMGWPHVRIEFENDAYESQLVDVRDVMLILTPVVHYQPEAQVVAEHPAIEEASDLPFLNDSAQPEVVLSMEAWDLLSKIILLDHAPVANCQGASAQLAELQAAGLIEIVGDGFRATAAGIVADGVEVELPRTPLDDMQDARKAGLRLVPLASIVVTTNTRKVFDETALAELAESVKAHGILQPVVLRPHPTEEHRYELVAGGRRYQAAQRAGLAEMPATVRNLNDREFMEVQLLENLQRVDVRPADEAQAFSKLLKNDFSAEEVALKVGKPVKFVLQRAKLTHLIPFWMELLEADRLPLVAAHELARLPAHSQVVVKKWIEEYKAWELEQAGALDAGTIRHAINQEVMRKLDGAAFPKDDATLCPAAGACITCPKNSANSRGLFDEVGTDAQTGKCLDAACFGQKKDAFLTRRKKELVGTDVPMISTSYASPPAGALGYKFYDRAKEGDKGAVPALLVDGADAGAISWVKLSKGAPDAQTVAQDNKAEKAASIKVNRIKKMTNEVLAEKLRETFTAELLDPSAGTGAAHALLDHWLKRSLTFGKTRTPNDMLSHLVACYGWEEPTEAELVSTWSDKGDSPHYVYLKRQLAAMPNVLNKVALFFDLKIREGLEQTEYTGTQATLAKALPKSYQPSFDVAEQAESLVQARYYSKGKKQEATA